MPASRRIDSPWSDDQFRARLEIDRCCRAFERVWQETRTTTIESVLLETDLPWCSELTTELLAVEWELRKNNGEHPVVEDYLTRFPQHKAFLEELASAALDDTGMFRLDDTVHQQPEVVGDFSLLGRIGQGGMGTVYEAVRQRDGMRVALKMLPSLLSRQPGLRERFDREVAIAATLLHPNIVPAIAWNIETEPPFLAMQLVEGESLRDRLAHWANALSPQTSPSPGATTAGVSSISPVSANPLGAGPVTASVPSLADRSAFARRVGIEVADALHYAHQQGILHRDIKPSNILLRDNVALLTDFGLAKVLNTVDDLTLFGDFIGTLRYAAPETLDQHHDVRSEVYSLGLTLYEILTLKPAFPQTEHVALVKAVTLGATLSFHETTSLTLRHVVRRACAIQPHDRYPTLQALADALRNCPTSPLEEPLPSQHPKPLRWLLWGSIAFCLALVAALAIWWWAAR